MSEDKLQYITESRRNVHVQGCKEWALKIRINEGDWWTIDTFLKKPPLRTIKQILSIAERVCEVYHKSVFEKLIPKFTLTRIDDA